MLPNEEREGSYWRPMFNQTMLHLQQAGNAPIDRIVQERLTLANETI